MSFEIKPGDRFCRFTVLEFAGRVKSHIVWKCLCDCGQIKVVRGSALAYGSIKSCGCIRFTPRTHGHGSNIHPSQTYTKWRSMRRRCSPTCKSNYDDYFARGIRVCQRWEAFSNFLADMGEAPDGMELDRINNDLGYFKENCRWATREENQNNRRVSLRLTIDGNSKPLKQWAKEFGLDYQTVTYRFKTGRPIGELFQPPHSIYRKKNELAKTS